MWLPNDTPGYWSARKRELIAMHDAQRMIRAARKAEGGGALDRARPVSAILAGYRSSVKRCSAAARALANAAVEAPRLGHQRPAPRRG
jgi:hypothetical protein